MRDDLLALLEQAGSCDGNSELVTATYEARSHPDLYRTVSGRFGAFVREELERFVPRAHREGCKPLASVELDLVRDTIVALLAHYGGPAGEPVTRERLIDLVDHVLLVLLTGTRTAD